PESRRRLAASNYFRRAQTRRQIDRARNMRVDASLPAFSPGGYPATENGRFHPQHAQLRFSCRNLDGGGSSQYLSNARRARRIGGKELYRTGPSRRTTSAALGAGQSAQANRNRKH